MSDISLKNFLEIPYDQLEEMNLAAKEKLDSIALSDHEKEYRDYLEKEKRIKAVTLCFSDIEGRLHMLDYDKKFLLASAENLTFDGSSIRGFTALHESDLRLSIDWASIVWLPADIFGSGKVIMFANILGRDRIPYESDFRGQLQLYLQKLKQDQDMTAFAAPELEGFLVDDINAEQRYEQKTGFTLTSIGGFFPSFPFYKPPLFLHSPSATQPAIGIFYEKDHPQVDPSPL